MIAIELTAMQAGVILEGIQNLDGKRHAEGWICDLTDEEERARRLVIARLRRAGGQPIGCHEDSHSGFSVVRPLSRKLPP